MTPYKMDLAAHDIAMEYLRLTMLVEEKFGRTAHDITRAQATFTLLGSVHDFIDEVRRMIGAERAVMHEIGDALLEGPDVIASVHCDNANDPFTVSRTFRKVQFIGKTDAVKAAHAALNARFEAEMLATVTWIYGTGEGRYGQANVVLDPPPPLFPEFYPWIADGPDLFLRNYLASTATLLFMYGAPGTGKTSLIRHLVCKHIKHATITYEDGILKKDGMFVNFMMDKNPGVLIIEDADDMLASRKHHGNELVARFLNVSDGLIKFRNKKIVLTTNLEDFKEVDPALIRPGRCFAVTKFRALTASEADAAATRIGVEPLGRSATLAELFAGRMRLEPDIAPPRFIGLRANGGNHDPSHDDDYY